MTDFIFNLAMGVMMTVASISFFFAAVLLAEKIIRLKPLKQIKGIVTGVVKIIRVWRAL